MITVVENRDRGQHEDLLRQMHRIRARVFHERLGWDVSVADGLEIDAFDALDPVYLLSVDEWTGRVEGSLRLLPTTGPNMLRDVFGVLLPEGDIVESPTIWESSRFSMDPDLPREEPGRRLNRVTTDLLCGIVEVGLTVGLTYVVSVYDARMVRIFRAADCPAAIIGRPTRIGGVMCYAGLFEISEEMRERIGRAGGREEPVLADAARLRRAA